MARSSAKYQIDLSQIKTLLRIIVITVQFRLGNRYPAFASCFGESGYRDYCTKIKEGHDPQRAYFWLLLDRAIERLQQSKDQDESPSVPRSSVSRRTENLTAGQGSDHTQLVGQLKEFRDKKLVVTPGDEWRLKKHVYRKGADRGKTVLRVIDDELFTDITIKGAGKIDSLNGAVLPAWARQNSESISEENLLSSKSEYDSQMKLFGLLRLFHNNAGRDLDSAASMLESHFEPKSASEESAKLRPSSQI